MTSQRPSQPSATSELAAGLSVARQLVGAEVLVIDRDEQVREGLSELLAEASEEEAAELADEVARVESALADG